MALPPKILMDGRGLEKTISSRIVPWLALSCGKQSGVTHDRGVKNIIEQPGSRPKPAYRPSVPLHGAGLAYPRSCDVSNREGYLHCDKNRAEESTPP